jgi:two-component system, sensor histidine kinase PdtaS
MAPLVPVPVLMPAPEMALTLALAVVDSSTAPLLLLDGECRVIAASASFATAFRLEPDSLAGVSVFAIGAGEWDVPRLRSLLTGTVSGAVDVPAYEIDLTLPGRGKRRLVLNAHKLAYADTDGGAEGVRILLSLADVTDARLADRIKDDLIAEKAMLLKEIQHRVANSLQIIASVLMQSARKVGSSEETRVHLRDAHGRVMAIADLQRQLAESNTTDVEVGSYLAQLCQSLAASMIENDERLVLTVSADASRISANASVSIGLVVTELVINALKHGFPDARHGRIVVEYKRFGDDWTLRVSDDGVGMPAGNNAVAGLGTSIVNALAKHLEAVVRVSDAAPGTIVALVHEEAAERDLAGAEEIAV